MHALSPVLPLCCCLIACGNPNSRTIPQLPPAYKDVSPQECVQSGINGHWKLIEIRTEGKHTVNVAPIEMNITACSFITYSSGTKLLHRDTFRLFRVIRYCDDYQLRYPRTDSINCLDIVKDTLIIGACNNYSEPRFVYLRQDHLGA